MPRKTRKQMKRQRRKTLRRIPKKKGGADSQSLVPPSSAFKVAAPVNSDNEWYKIA